MCRVLLSVKVITMVTYISTYPSILYLTKRFHQDLKVNIVQYQSRWNRNIMADYLRSLQGDCYHKSHERKPHKRRLSEAQ